jgi:hypothetical protein
MIRLIFSVHVAARDILSPFDVTAAREPRCCWKHLYRAGWAQSGWSTVGPALTLAVAGRGAISERWVVAAHLPESA